MKKIIFLCTFIFVTTNLFAQEDSVRVNISITEWDRIKSERNDLIDSIKVLNGTLFQCQIKTNNDSLRLERLSFLNDSLTTRLKRLHIREEQFVKDSIRIKNDSLKLVQEYNLKSQQLEEKIRIADYKSARADTIAIQMMITYLDLKCSKERIEELRRNFESIPNDTLKREYKGIDEILSLYTETRDKIISLANGELKSKNISSATSALYQDIYISEYRQQLDNLSYVKEYYKSEDYTSSYLNKMLDISYDALETKNIELLKSVTKL